MVAGWAIATFISRPGLRLRSDPVYYPDRRVKCLVTA